MSRGAVWDVLAVDVHLVFGAVDGAAREGADVGEGVRREPAERADEEEHDGVALDVQRVVVGALLSLDGARACGVVLL